MIAMHGDAPRKSTFSERSLALLTVTPRSADSPIWLVRVSRERKKSNSSWFSSGLRRCISRNFLGSHCIIMMRATVYPLAPRSVTFWATTTSMPEMTDITEIRVVVARMMPNSVRKLRSLADRSDWAAPFTASQNDALPVLIYDLDDSYGPFIAFVPRSSAKPSHRPRTWTPCGRGSPGDRRARWPGGESRGSRSEEHTSE